MNSVKTLFEDCPVNCCGELAAWIGCGRHRWWGEVGVGDNGCCFAVSGFTDLPKIPEIRQINGFGFIVAPFRPY